MHFAANLKEPGGALLTLLSHCPSRLVTRGANVDRHATERQQEIHRVSARQQELHRKRISPPPPTFTFSHATPETTEVVSVLIVWCVMKHPDQNNILISGGLRWHSKKVRLKHNETITIIVVILTKQTANCLTPLEAPSIGTELIQTCPSPVLD